MAYIATICILIDVPTESEAMDAVAESMRPLLKAYDNTSCIRDWMYDNSSSFGELVKVQDILQDFVPDNEWPDAL